MTETQNPFFTAYHTPHQTAPFHLIKMEHYEPAILQGMEEQNKEIEAIISNPEEPTFANTIVALEKSGNLLNRVSTVFGNLMSAETCDEMEALAEKLMPMLTEHSNNITLNEALFARIDHVYTSPEKTTLSVEENALLENTYRSFVRCGAKLSGEDKEKFRSISTTLSLNTLKFSQNRLKETNSFELILNEEQLSGLPQSAIEAYAQTAKEKGKEGYIVTLSAPSFGPFMKYSTCRELRKQLYTAYHTQCTHDNEFNNLDIVKTLVNLRLQHAQLLGYPTVADYTLTRRMAENSTNVYRLLHQLLEAYKPTALHELEEVKAIAKEMEGEDFEMQPWDFSYYVEKLKEKKFNFNEESLRPYFELSQVIEGVFGLATRLYGITFQENKDIPVYHTDVKAYEVFDKDGKFLAVLYADFHPRAGKRSGAWMTSY